MLRDLDSTVGIQFWRDINGYKWIKLLKINACLYKNTTNVAILDITMIL